VNPNPIMSGARNDPDDPKCCVVEGDPAQVLCPEPPEFAITYNSSFGSMTFYFCDLHYQDAPKGVVAERLRHP